MSPDGRKPAWAPEEDERLRALALSGASVAEMAKQMKRSEESCPQPCLPVEDCGGQVAQVEAEGEGEMNELEPDAQQQWLWFAHWRP